MTAAELALKRAKDKYPGCMSCLALGVWHCAHPEECGHGGWPDQRKVHAEAEEPLLELLMKLTKREICHTEECDSIDCYKDVIVGEVGTGPWDTHTEPAPCTCGLDELLANIDSTLETSKEK